MSKIEKKKELEAEHKSLTRKKALIQYVIFCCSKNICLG